MNTTTLRLSFIAADSLVSVALIACTSTTIEIAAASSDAGAGASEAPVVDAAGAVDSAYPQGSSAHDAGIADAGPDAAEPDADLTCTGYVVPPDAEVVECAIRQTNNAGCEACHPYAFDCTATEAGTPGSPTGLDASAARPTPHAQTWCSSVPGCVVGQDWLGGCRFPDAGYAGKVYVCSMLADGGMYVPNDTCTFQQQPLAPAGKLSMCCTAPP